MRMKVEEIDQIVERYNRDGKMTRTEIDYLYNLPQGSNHYLLTTYAVIDELHKESKYGSHAFNFYGAAFKVAHAELMARLE